jgi:hypothetical protein
MKKSSVLCKCGHGKKWHSPRGIGSCCHLFEDGYCVEVSHAEK